MFETEGRQQQQIEPAKPEGAEASEAQADELLGGIVDAQGSTPAEIAGGLAVLPEPQRDAAIGAVHRRFGNAFAGSVVTESKKKLKSFIPGKAALYQARLDMDGRKEGVLADTHEIPNQDIVVEQLAHAGTKGKVDAKKLAAWGYKEAGAVEDFESGFRAVLYVPLETAESDPQGAMARAIHGGAAPPVLAFRGTDNRRGAADDANRHGVGTYQFSSNQGRIKGMLDAAGDKVISAGHSLGGALAQLTACTFPESVSRVVTFQAPGIEKAMAAKLREHNAAAAPEDQVKSTHHRAEGDLVHMGGAALTDGDVYTFESVGIGSPLDHTMFPLARLAAARGNLIDGIEGQDRLVRVKHTTAEAEKSAPSAAFAEGARKSLGGVLRQDDMEPYVAFWNDIQAMLASGAFSQSYVLAVIRDTDRLNDVQKIKMRDQVAGYAPSNA